MTTITEADVEQAALDWLSALGWKVAHGPDIAPGTPNAERTDYGQVVLERRVQDSLAELNPSLPPSALDDAFPKLTRSEGATLEARNRAFHRMLVDGVTVEHRTDGGTIRGAQAQVVDFDLPANNDWLAVNQFTVTENRNTRRPDIALFVNGLPLTVIELKNPADEDATIWTAWQQPQTYKAELPSMFSTNEALMVSDRTEARIGTLTSGREWFKPWRTITGEGSADPHLTELQVILEGVFEPSRFLSMADSRTMAAAHWSRRWPGITSSTPSELRWMRPCGRRGCNATRHRSPRRADGTRQAANPVESLATGASAWSGIPKDQARA